MAAQIRRGRLVCTGEESRWLGELHSWFEGDTSDPEAIHLFATGCLLVIVNIAIGEARTALNDELVELLSDTQQPQDNGDIRIDAAPLLTLLVSNYSFEDLLSWKPAILHGTKLMKL